MLLIPFELNRFTSKPPQYCLSKFNSHDSFSLDPTRRNKNQKNRNRNFVRLPNGQQLKTYSNDAFYSEKNLSTFFFFSFLAISFIYFCFNCEKQSFPVDESVFESLCICVQCLLFGRHTTILYKKKSITIITLRSRAFYEFRLKFTSIFFHLLMTQYVAVIRAWYMLFHTQIVVVCGVVICRLCTKVRHASLKCQTNDRNDRVIAVHVQCAPICICGHSMHKSN